MRPVYGITVMRYEDGRTEVEDAHIGDGSPADHSFLMPESWELRHRMLIDALEQVKREAGVEHAAPVSLLEQVVGPLDEEEDSPDVALGPEHFAAFASSEDDPEEPAFRSSATIASSEQEGGE